MAAWLPGSQGSHGTMVGPRAVSSGVISGLAKQDSQGLGDAQRLLEKTSRTTINDLLVLWSTPNHYRELSSV
jgi:hypothetical protein